MCRVANSRQFSGVLEKIVNRSLGIKRDTDLAAIHHEQRPVPGIESGQLRIGDRPVQDRVMQEHQIDLQVGHNLRTNSLGGKRLRGGVGKAVQCCLEGHTRSQRHLAQEHRFGLAGRAHGNNDAGNVAIGSTGQVVTRGATGQPGQQVVVEEGRIGAANLPDGRNRPAGQGAGAHRRWSAAAQRFTFKSIKAGGIVFPCRRR